MKRFFIGLIAAIITFAIGIAAFENFDPESIIIPNVAVEEVTACNFPDELRIQSSDEDVFSGWYSFGNIQSKGMKEVNMISLLKNNDDKDDKISAYGGVFTTLEDYGDQGFFSSVSTQIDGYRVKFRTEKIKGISYRFEGIFFNNEITGKEDEEFLRGTLQKFVKGKKVAEFSGNLIYSEPQCWH